jgi:hypothetical protein
MKNTLKNDHDHTLKIYAHSNGIFLPAKRKWSVGDLFYCMYDCTSETPRSSDIF